MIKFNYIPFFTAPTPKTRPTVGEVCLASMKAIKEAVDHAEFERVNALEASELLQRRAADMQEEVDAGLELLGAYTPSPKAFKAA